MIHHDHTEGKISLDARSDQKGVERQRTVELHLTPPKRNFTVNSKKVSVAEGITGEIPVVVFTPDHLKLIKDSASRRREEIEGIGRQLSKNYMRLSKEYLKTLKGRNRLLAEGLSRDPAFDAWTEQLVTLGAALYQHRVKLLERLGTLTKEQHADLDATCDLETTYVNNWGARPEADRAELEEAFFDVLAQQTAYEMARKTTVVGPHRDDIVFLLDGHDARAFGSQGQQRTIALSWKLAQIDLIRELRGTDPVLLLDDVMSELDQARRDALVAKVGEDSQTIITTTNIHYFDPSLIRRAHLIEITKKGGENDRQ